MFQLSKPPQSFGCTQPAIISIHMTFHALMMSVLPTGTLLTPASWHTSSSISFPPSLPLNHLPFSSSLLSVLSLARSLLRLSRGTGHDELPVPDHEGVQVQGCHIFNLMFYQFFNFWNHSPPSQVLMPLLFLFSSVVPSFDGALEKILYRYVICRVLACSRVSL